MSTRPKRALSIIGYLIGFAILGVILYLGGEQSLHLAATPRLSLLFLCFLSTIAIIATGSIRWGYLINQMADEKATSYFHYFAYSVSGRFFGQYVSQAGGTLLVRPGLLSYLGNVPLKVSLSATLLEKIFDLTFIVATVIPCALYLFGYLTGFTATLLAILMIALLLFLAVNHTERLLALGTSLLKRIYSLLKRIKPLENKLGNKHLQQIEAINSMLLLKPRALFNAVALTVLRYGLLVARLYLLDLALDLTIPAPVLIAGLPLAQLSLIFALTPGAVGILEAGWYAIFAVAHVPEIERSAFLIAQRVFWSIFIGIIFMITYVVFGANRSRLNRLKRSAGKGKETSAL